MLIFINLPPKIWIDLRIQAGMLDAGCVGVGIQKTEIKLIYLTLKT